MIGTPLAHNTGCVGHGLCFYQTTRRHIPEDSILHVDCYDSLKLDGAASRMQHSEEYTQLAVPDPHPILSPEIQNVRHFVCWVVVWYYEAYMVKCTEQLSSVLQRCTGNQSFLTLAVDVGEW
jgi:hypothetical protein